jgi:hypothetical protein
MWQIIVGKTRDGKKEYQVSDGEAYDGTNNFNERTCSYDFTNLEEAKELCNKLKKKGKNNMNNVTKKQCLEAIDYLWTEGFIDDMTTDKRHYTTILLKKVANDYNIELEQ